MARKWLNRVCQVLLSMNPLSLMKLFGCNYISIVSLTSTVHITIYPSQSGVLQNFMRFPVCVMCSPAADISGWPRQKCLTCSLCLISILLRVCPTYTFSHSQGIQYMPGVMRPRFCIIQYLKSDIFLYFVNFSSCYLFFLNVFFYVLTMVLHLHISLTVDSCLYIVCMLPYNFPRTSFL